MATSKPALVQIGILFLSDSVRQLTVQSVEQRICASLKQETPKSSQTKPNYIQNSKLTPYIGVVFYKQLQNNQVRLEKIETSIKSSNRDIGNMNTHFSSAKAVNLNAFLMHNSSY